MAASRFIGSFTPQEPILREGITAALERGYATWPGVGYCLALPSGGQALQVFGAAGAPLAGFLLTAAGRLGLAGAA